VIATEQYSGVGRFYVKGHPASCKLKVSESIVSLQQLRCALDLANMIMYCCYCTLYFFELNG